MSREVKSIEMMKLETAKKSCSVPGEKNNDHVSDESQWLREKNLILLRSQEF